MNLMIATHNFGSLNKTFLTPCLLKLTLTNHIYQLRSIRLAVLNIYPMVLHIVLKLRTLLFNSMEISGRLIFPHIPLKWRGLPYLKYSTVQCTSVLSWLKFMTTL